MKICFLTQTGIDISDYYKTFFAGHDLFFVTFKEKNDGAVDYMPKSTWSSGRNRLWEEVKGKYDYYVFLDDDLKFLRPQIPGPPLAVYLLHKAKAVFGHDFSLTYKPSSSKFFLSRLAYYLKTYRPEVLTVVKFTTPTMLLDAKTLRNNSFVRRIGWFDAEFTVLSQLAASKLLPYDNKVSGWHSAQIPIYLYANNVFGAKAIVVTELAGINTNTTTSYTPGYSGPADCRIMLEQLSKATAKNFNKEFDPETGVNLLYGADGILQLIPEPADTEDYVQNYAKRLVGLENLLHSHVKF